MNNRQDTNNRQNMNELINLVLFEDCKKFIDKYRVIGIPSHDNKHGITECFDCYIRDFRLDIWYRVMMEK